MALAVTTLQAQQICLKARYKMPKKFAIARVLIYPAVTMNDAKAGVSCQIFPGLFCRAEFDGLRIQNRVLREAVG